jgi:4-hydroxybenzoate polyprenyltransferase
MTTTAEQRISAKGQTQGAFSRFLRLIRFSHTVFALPFALGALLVAARGYPSLRTLGLVLLCMIFARTAAMLFNRLADWQLDQRNPRTSERHLLVTKPALLFSLIVSSLAFVLAAAALNRTTAILSPLALIVIFFYSLTKHFTHATHFFLGLALAVAPAGAWLAQTGRLALPPVILSVGVICWVAGFDLIYATQDYEFDEREGLHSLVVRLGLARALRLAEILHLAMFVALVGFGYAAGLGPIYYGALPFVAVALVYEHGIMRRMNVTRINQAFFQSNAFVSAIFLAAVCLDLWL